MSAYVLVWRWWERAWLILQSLLERRDRSKKNLLHALTERTDSRSGFKPLEIDIMLKYPKLVRYQTTT